MRSASPRSNDGGERKRRAHAKSRTGCGNCKLRRVKCDETRPQCKKCQSYGVSCNYDGKTSLDLCTQGTFQVELSPRSSNSPLQQSTSTPSPALSSASLSVSESRPPDLGSQSRPPLELTPTFYAYADEDLATLKRFVERTVNTIGPQSSVAVYRDRVAPMAFNHPFLMHMILSLTLLHDAFLALSVDMEEQYTNNSLGHWNIATKLYNEVLSGPIDPDARDALWATASLMGVNVFAYIESSTVERAWPLKPSEPNDLNWLRLSDGKRAIWKLVNPTRADSVFHDTPCLQTFNTISAWIEENYWGTVPHDVLIFFGITPSSSSENNPYHLILLLLARVLSPALAQDNVYNFFFFMGYMPPDFCHLLERRDTRAMILMGWWFKRLASTEVWWLQRRSIVEGQGITIWLEKYMGGDEPLMQMYKRFRERSNTRKGKSSMSLDAGFEWAPAEEDDVEYAAR